MEFKFKVCQEDLPGLPGLEKGDAVFPVASEIIEGYDGLRVESVAGDPTACRVSFTFRVVQGLLRIHLYAHILV